jgi:hypothetical protein
MKLTVAELAAFLGMSRAGVRKVISRHRIQAAGKGHFGAKLYDAQAVLRHTGARDRLSA